MKYIVCICDKLCTSKAGLVLHQRKCTIAISANKKGEKSVKEDEEISFKNEYKKPAKNFLELAEEIAHDADQALRFGNKSAGRRSRTNMIKLREVILSLRKEVLQKINKKE